MNSLKKTPSSTFLIFLQAIAFAIGLAAPSAFAASQTWTNAPVDQNWGNTNNWVGLAVPGALNLTGNTVNNDTATFNSPIPLSGIGGAANPISPDDATVLNDRSRQIGSILFDTANCGAYVFYSASPAVLPTTLNAGTGILYVSHNGSITMNPAVANNQTFLVPLNVRLPSSTAGIYNFVNNSTNAATLYIDTVTNGSANTRGTVFVLGGSNTGTNTVGLLSAGTTTTGGNGLTKQGTGTWILASGNDFRTQTIVNIIGGTLIVKDSGAFSIANAGNVTISNSVLEIDGVTLNQTAVNLNNGGNIRMNGTASLNGVVLGAQLGNNATLSTTSATDVFTVGTALSLNSMVGGGAADTILNTAGPGTLVFNQVNSYIGKWSFNATSNQIANASALGTGANANVGAGAVLDLTQLGATTFVPTTAGLGGSGTGTAVGSTAAAIIADPAATVDLTSKNVNLTFTPMSTSGDLTHPALYIAQGSLTLSGNTFFINNAAGSPLGVGTYRLIQQATGSITSGGSYAVLVSGSGMASGTAASIQVSGGNVDLVVAVYVPQNLSWTGGSANANWDVGTDLNWWDGTSQVAFHNSDIVTFNSIGSTNPIVNLVGTLAPDSVTVDTSANDYTFSGSGQVAGTTALNKISTGVLNLQTVNTYAGGTVVSNGTLRVGVNNAISGTGAGDVAVYGTGVIDLNGFNNTIDALVGDGTVDVQNGGSSTLTVGNNDNSGTFSGLLKNTSGTLNIAKLGTGTETLGSSNSYTGTTTITTGTLRAADPNALGGGASAVTVNATLDVASANLNVSSLAGAGSVVNNSTATTNIVAIVGAAATTFSGTAANGTGGGALALQVLGGSLTMSGVNTYTGGTTVGTGASFLIANAAAVTGPLIASNGATVGFSGGNVTTATPTSITTVDGGTVTFTSGAEGKVWNSAFIGAADTTNLFSGPQSAGGSLSFSNFLGVARISATTQNFRFLNGGGTSGGADTTFQFDVGNVHSRDSQTVILGAISGGATNAGIGGASTAGAVTTYIIGAKGVDNVFQGYISGSNNIVKAGSAKLTLDGVSTVALTDNSTYTNYVAAPLLSYTGTTTVSNGVLAVVVPNSFTNSSSITLAGATAVLDASQLGYISNQTDILLGVTNQVLVTNGIFEVHSGQTAGGFGTIWGELLADGGSIINAGLPTGTLTATNGIDLESSTVNLNLNRTNTQTSSEIAAAGSTAIVVNGGTLNVTNLGPDLVTGDVFQLFNKAVTGSGFTTINLPTANAANTITYVYQTNIMTDGSITVVQGAAPIATNPTNITFSVSGNTLNLSWPADHTGWTLQVQTNSLSTGLGTNWVDVPGSTAVNSTNMVMDPNNPTVFFRLKY